MEKALKNLWELKIREELKSKQTIIAEQQHKTLKNIQWLIFFGIMVFSAIAGLMICLIIYK